MPRLAHGTVTTIQQLQAARDQLATMAESVPLAFTLAVPTDTKDFGFMFEHLQADPVNLLAEAPATAANLIALGVAMEDPDVGAPGDPGDSDIPAVYTYFGQFVDHDITMEAESGGIILDPTTTPMPLADINSIIVNTRTATFDLDSLYGFPAPRDPVNPDKMLLGAVSAFGNRPPGKGDDNDVPRKPRNAADPIIDREALIGDPRNDENLIIAQMQVAFLKAHNVLVGQGLTFEQARTRLRQHYQHVVVHDFLRRVCDNAVVDDILTNGPKAFNPPDHLFFMPLEFSVAAYRFGHSMIRAQYNFNLNFLPASLDLLFTFTALTGQLGFGPGLDTLPENWIIEWENFVDGTGPTGMTRRIDTNLVEPLFRLRNETGQTLPDASRRLAVRNLLRGYLLRMPTGQAVAATLGLPVMTPAEIQAAAGNAAQVTALQNGGFLDRTPLWYYVLAEAAHHGGNKLGPVGSTIVADVIIGLVKRSEDSIFNFASWTPTLPSATPGTFILSDLLAFAGVLPAPPPPPPPPPPPGGQTYVVQPGDSLSSIAQNELGDANRWPEIFALNRDQIADPNLIFPGQVLNLPDAGAPPPPPRTYTVRQGDSLSSIAQNELGDANRWPEIFNLNQSQIVDPNLIFPGQVLVLP